MRVCLSLIVAVSMLWAQGGCKPNNAAPAPTPRPTTPPTPAPVSNEIQTTPAPSPQQQQPPSPSPAEKQENVPPPSDSTRYNGPPFTVQIVQAKRLPPISTAMIEVTVPTGGWTLKLDKTEVTGDTAKIFVTLERPGDGEMTTQALVTHKEQYTSEKPPFTKAEVYVHLAQRDVHTLTTNYRLAAKY